MAIAFVASQEGNSGTDATSYSIAPLPTGTTVGNVCFVVIACPTPTTGTPTFSGWTLVREFASSSAHRASVWYRVVQSGDADATAFTFDQPGTAEGISWVSCEYSGVNTDSPLIDEDGAFTANDADGDLATPSIDNNDVNAWLVHAIAASDLDANDTTVAFTTSPAMTERNDIDGSATTEVAGAAWYDSNAAVAHASFTQTGSHDSTVAMDMAVWVGILNPAYPPGSAQAGGSLLVQRQAVTTASSW
jgi:hypothetical protein